MLINTLKKKYNEIEDKLTNVIDYIYDTMLYISLGEYKFYGWAV